MMNPEIKTKWVEALRSGEYQQGTNSLLHEGRYCCLGVLCDLYSKEKECDFPHEQLQVPGAGVVEWAGLEKCNPTMWFNGKYDKLTSLNDYEAVNFKELADLIEEQL